MVSNQKIYGLCALILVLFWSAFIGIATWLALAIK